MRAIGYDRVIESPIEVPGALAIDPSQDVAADLRIDTLRAISAPPDEQPVYQLAGTSLLFSPPRLATFRCRPERISISPYIGADADHIRALLIATALPATLWMLGALVLHAAAVRLPGLERAIAFAGPSGAGKSSIAAALVRRGATLVADDSVRIARSAGIALASGLPGGWFEAAAGGAPRPFRPAPNGRSLRRCRLGSIVILSDGLGEGPPERIDPVAAVEQILANLHRPRIASLLGHQLETLRFCGFLADAVPVYVWRRAHGSRVIDDRAVEALMRCVEA